jgi:hypothetical protein
VTPWCPQRTAKPKYGNASDSTGGARDLARGGIDSSQRLGPPPLCGGVVAGLAGGYRRLQVRYERRSDILLGLLQLAGALIAATGWTAQARRRAVGTSVWEACRSAGGREHPQGIEGEHLVRG